MRRKKLSLVSEYKDRSQGLALICLVSLREPLEFKINGSTIRYVPEKTCRMEPTTIGNRTFCEARVHEYECYSCEGFVVTYHDDEKPKFCPNCGAKVVGD